MNGSRINVTSWPHPKAPTKIELSDMLHGEGLQTQCWSESAGHVSELLLHSYDSVLYVLEGRITFRLPESRRSINLNTGDRIDLPAYVVHNAVVGPEGVTCVEGKR